MSGTAKRSAGRAVAIRLAVLLALAGLAASGAGPVLAEGQGQTATVPSAASGGGTGSGTGSGTGTGTGTGPATGATTPAGATGSEPGATPGAGTTTGTGTATPATPATGGTTGTTSGTTGAAAKPRIEPDSLERPIISWRSEIDALERGIDRAESYATDTDLPRIRADLARIAEEADAYRKSLEPRAAEVKEQIRKLGKAPGAEDPAEPQSIAAERAQLQALRTAIEGARKGADVAGVRIEQLLTRIDDLRRKLFTEALLLKTRGLVQPDLWVDAARDAATGFRQIATVCEMWWRQTDQPLAVVALIALTVLLWWVLNRLGRLALRRVRDRTGGSPGSLASRLGSASWATLVHALPTIGAIGFYYFALGPLGMLTGYNDRIAVALVRAVVTFALVVALARAVLAPRAPSWRIFPLSDDTVRRVMRLVMTIAGLFVLDQFAQSFGRIITVPAPLMHAGSLGASVALAVLVLVFVATRFHTISGTDPSPPRLWPAWLKVPLLVSALAIIALALAGYAALARFVSTQVVETTSIIVGLVVLHLLIRALVGAIRQDHTGVADWLERAAGLDDYGRNYLAIAAAVVLNILLAVSAAPLLLLQWGFDGGEIVDTLTRLAQGIEIGSIRLSVTTVIGSIVAFLAMLFLTRLMQRWLEASVLTRPRVDSGTANSVLTVTGYAGTALAVVAAAGMMGLDFTNLAIIAGALSVGIGFGLQSIVNNFVSGLILLIERPVKVGDWIVTGSEQGYVRRISIRSTEIETFDRASVIVPNVDLITGRVLNWTHRDSIGRVMVKVGVAYGTDPQRVIDILKKAADGHPRTLAHPAASVSFDDFGASSLDFTLRAFIADVNEILIVATDLRVKILKEFQAAGIEIPFPQTDVHLRDLDWVRAGLSRAIAERQAARAGQGGGKGGSGRDEGEATDWNAVEAGGDPSGKS
ncbi:MAG: DUF3772 domain-containing protein [Hyphomicrobiaceae bacterium]